MSPGPLRPESVQRRLAEMAALLTVLAKHATVTGEDLVSDLERRLVIERALQQTVDLAVKINAHVVTAEGAAPPADYHTSFGAAADVGLIDAVLGRRLAPSAGLRNRLVHEYDEIDLAILAGSIDEAVDGYREYVRQVADWLAARP